MTLSNNLARLFEHRDTIQVGNPTESEATIVLRVRPVDLPPDWLVSVSPMTVTLAAGEQAPVDVRITPGGPAVQGTRPRVAIEGYLGTELLGGVTMDVLVPENVLVARNQGSIFLPYIRRP